MKQHTVPKTNRVLYPTIGYVFRRFGPCVCCNIHLAGSVLVSSLVTSVRRIGPYACCCIRLIDAAFMSVTAFALWARPSCLLLRSFYRRSLHVCCYVCSVGSAFMPFATLTVSTQTLCSVWSRVFVGSGLVSDHKHIVFVDLALLLCVLLLHLNVLL